MSEETKTDWKKEMKELIREELKEWKPKIDLPSSTPNTKEPEHKHFSESDDICPDCYPTVRKKVFEKEFKDADHECMECGLPVKGEESGKNEWNCPNCGHTYAKPRD